MQRDGKFFRADVFTKRKQRAVPAEIIDCRSSAVIDLDLFDAWIALDINDAVTGEQVVVEFLRAADVEDRVGFAVEVADFF